MRRLSLADQAQQISQVNFDDDEEIQVLPGEENFREIPYHEIMKYMTPKYLQPIGMIASFLASLSLPMFGYILSQYMFLLANASESYYREEANNWALAFMGLCLLIGLTTGIQKLCFGLGGENLTQTLRVKLFDALLRKNIGWFDDKNRAPGILTNMISEDLTAINGLTTETAGIALEAFLGLFLSCCVCFYFSWRLALVVSATCPFMVLGGLGMSRLQFNQAGVDSNFKQANALLSDIIINYRTCIAFGDKNL